MIKKGQFLAAKKMVGKLDHNLKPFQIDGVIYQILHKKIIQGDDMGLGKTYQSISAVEATDRYPCLVVCQAFLKHEKQWEKEWNKWYPHRSVSTVNKDVDINADVIVLNYEILEKLPKIKKIEFKSMIVDESHYVKNPKSQRSKSVLKYAKKVDFISLLTGTVIENKTSDIINQLKIIGRFNEISPSWEDFIVEYCGGKKNGFGWDYTGATNSDKLNKKLREVCYIRRLKSEVMGELPPVTIETINLDCDPKIVKSYNIASGDLLEFLTDEETYSAFRAQALSKLTMLKKLSMEMKLKSIVKWISMFLENTQSKLLVLGVQTKFLKLLHEQVDNSLIIVGGSDKSKVKDQFINNKERVLFSNMKSIGTGVDGLQKVCSHLAILENPDTPGIMNQSISRLDRIGQKEPVSVYKLFSEFGIDYKSGEILSIKNEEANMVMNGKGSNASIKLDMDYELLKILKDGN